MEILRTIVKEYRIRVHNIPELQKDKKRSSQHYENQNETKEQKSQKYISDPNKLIDIYA